MIWKTINVTELSRWIEDQQAGLPPEAYQLLAPPSLDDIAANVPFIAPFYSYLRIHPRSGAVDVNVPEWFHFTEDILETLSNSIAKVLDRREAFEWTGDFIATLSKIVAALDNREAFEWDGLDKEEEGHPGNMQSAVGREFWFSINNIRPVGPGGRITYYPRRRLIEIVVRRRGYSLGGEWRNPAEIVDRVLTYLEIADTPGTRLRARFGYYEASKYESQSLLRPVFLFLLDQPHANDGPRWRVSTAEAATELSDFPAAEGIGSTIGCA